MKSVVPVVLSLLYLTQLMKLQFYAFLEDKIAFGDIYKVVTSVLESMGPEDDFTLDNFIIHR